LWIPNGVDEELLEVQASGEFRKRHGIPANAPFVLTLSRLHPKKGIDLLLSAFVGLKTQNKLAEWHLVVAGDGEVDYVERLRRIARGTAAESAVHWVGWLENAAKFEALAEADLFVLSSFQENFGIGAVESMACGSPVLLSHQVGLAPVVCNAGAGWVVNLDGDGLRNSLVEVAGNSTELATRGDAARELVRERFTWPRIACEWTAVYERLSSKREACCCS